MKPLYLLTATLSLTSASVIAHRSVEPLGNELQRRFRGNRPGDRGYDYHDDPEYHRNGGRYSSEELLAFDRRARRDQRQESEELRPRRDDRPPPPPPESSSHRPAGSRPEERKKQNKQTRGFIEERTLDNGDKLEFRLGRELPAASKPDVKFYVKAGGEVKVGKDIFSGGRMDVESFEQAGARFRVGKYYADASYKFKQDLNPARPPPAPRPQPVEPVPGRRNAYYINGHEGRKPVYLDRDGRLRSEHSDRAIHGDRNVYLNNNGGQRKRSISVLGNINDNINAPSNSSTSLGSEWQSYYAVYTELRSNATDLLMPIFKDLVDKSNTSYAYEMAWSIHSQLTGSPNQYNDGPYLYGMSSLDNFVDNWLLSAGFWIDKDDGTVHQPANGTISNDTLILAGHVIANNDWLQETYYETWDASVAALNVTQGGSPHTLLDDLDYYAAVVTATNRTDVLDQSFTTADFAAAEAEAKWFLDGLNSYW